MIHSNFGLRRVRGVVVVVVVVVVVAVVRFVHTAIAVEDVNC